LNHVNSPAARRILFPADYFFALKVDDSAEFSVAPKIFLLLCKPSVLVIAAEIDFAVIFPVKLLSDQLTVLEIREAVSFAVAVGVLVYTTDLTVFKENSACAVAGGLWIFLAPHCLAVLIIDPNRRLPGPVGILTFALDFSARVEKVPGIYAAIVFAGDLLPLGLAGFVVYEDIGFTIEINVLFNLFNLSLSIIISPAIHLAVAIGISFLADDVASLIVKKAGHGLLACRRIEGQE